jgi:Apea-like HEPN
MTPARNKFLSNAELRTGAQRLLTAYKAAWKPVLTADETTAILADGVGRVILSDPPKGIRYTSELQSEVARFVLGAVEALGPKSGHQQTVHALTMTAAQAFAEGDNDGEAAVKVLLETLYDHNNEQFEYFDSNHLIRFEEGVREIRLGTVRAVATEDFLGELAARHPDEPVMSYEIGPVFKYEVAKFIFPPISWVVDIGAAFEHAQEEAKWLIDIMISFLRLHYRGHAPGLFPHTGDVEPHPIRPAFFPTSGIMFTAGAPRTGEWRTPPHYAVGTAIADIVKSEKFQAAAALLCEPPSRSLAERVSRGLGWLSRGRQSKDRSERLLHFFTAIESLLSQDDASISVADTIARHAGVLMSTEPLIRAGLARNIKDLYGKRSSLVHRGDRATLEHTVNTVQGLAELMFRRVLENADLSTTYKDFVDQLRLASFGLPWPKEAK